MSIVAGKQINSVSFDETILCTIEDNKDKDKGKYIVHYQNASFPAYSQTTNYQNGTKVYVTVPNGDWNQQKIIIGKYTSDNMTPFVFTLPFDTMFDMTGNLVSNNEEDVAVGMLLANSPKAHSRLSNGNYEMDGSSSKTSFAKEQTANIDEETHDNEMSNFVFNDDDLASQYYSHIYLNTKEAGDNLDELQQLGFYKLPIPQSGMDMLGIQADFTSWVNDAVVGDYGIAVQVAFQQPAMAEYKEQTAGAEEDTNNVKDYDIKTNQHTIVYTFILSNKDMYGNPYNFENNYTQQQVYPIKDLGTITHIRIAFFQDGNFRDSDGNRIVVLNSDFAAETGGDHDIADLLLENLFVRTVYVCAGCELSTLDDDRLEIYSNSGTTYNKKLNKDDKNKKVVDTRWVHLLEDKTPMDVVHGTNKYLDHFTLRWFQYDVSNTSADPRLGPFWKEIQTIVYDANNMPADFNYTDMFKLTFTPDINKQQEKIILIAEIDNIWYRSNTLIFDNEEIVPNNDTLKYENAIDIVAEDGSFGNYFVYSENGDLEENAIANELKYMYIAFDNNEDGVIDIEVDKLNEGTGIDGDFGDYNNVVWTLPLNQDSMLQFNLDDLTEGNMSKGLQQGYYYIDEARRKIHVPYRTCPKYRINGHYYPNKTENTVSCSFELNGRLYKTEKEFTFGQAGTMGTDQTIVIDFAEYSTDKQQYYSSDRNAVYLDETDKDIYLRLRLIDETGTIVDLNTTAEPGSNRVPTQITWFWAATSYVKSDGSIECYVDYEGKNAQETSTDGGVAPTETKSKDAYGLKIVPVEKDNQYVCLQKKPTFGMDQLYVIGAKVKVVNDVSYDLIAYFAIPIAANQKYSHISGPVKVNYLTSGEPYFYNVPYKLFEYTVPEDTHGNVSLGKTAQQVTNVSWRITQGDDFKGAITNGTDESRLNPYPLYIENAYLYGVNCYQGVDPANKPDSTTDVYDETVGGEQANLSDSTNTILWTQPIPIFINRYPSGTLNKWNGKDLIIDNENSMITARGIAAGKKNSDNTFSGVVLGDWHHKAEQSFTDNTGVYGIYRGQMSYQLRDDGTATFGRSGLGQILIDGNKGVIKSSDYEQNRQGMIIDLGRDVNDAAYDRGDGYPYIELRDGSDVITLRAQAYNSMIQLAGIIADDDSYNNKTQGNNIIRGKGSITLTNSGKAHPISINLHSDDSNIRSGDQFYVDWDGYLFSNTGQIGGWYIDDHTISANAFSNNPQTNKGMQTSRKNTFSTVVLDDSGVIRVGLKQYKTINEDGYVDRQQLADGQTYQNSIVIDGSQDAAYIAINLPSVNNCNKSGIYLKEDFEPNVLLEDDMRGPIFILDPTTDDFRVLGTIGMIFGNDGTHTTTNIGLQTFTYSGKYKDTDITNPSIILSSARNIRLSTAHKDGDTAGDHIFIYTSGNEYSTIDMQAKKVLINGFNIVNEEGRPVAYFA